MYTFKLQAVLDHRQFIEDNLKKELAEIRQQVITAQQQLDALEQKTMATAKALKADQAGGLPSNQVVAYHSYLKNLSDRILRQNNALIAVRENEAAKQGEVLEAMKGRQILEKLKEQGLDRYHQTILKKEMNFIDEIAVNRFARKTLNSHGDGQ